jgi:hypothetical protein
MSGDGYKALRTENRKMEENFLKSLSVDMNIDGAMDGAMTGNVVMNEDKPEEMNEKTNEETNEEMNEEESELPSFAFTDGDANEREYNIDAASLGLDEEFDMKLSELKQDLYNATVYAPPVGSDEAQDMQTLEQYEGLLLQLYNLAVGALGSVTPPSEIPPNILAQYPNSTKPLVAAYYLRVCDFQRTNRDRQLNDVLKDFLERRLKEQTSPYSRASDGEHSVEYS